MLNKTDKVYDASHDKSPLTVFVKTLNLRIRIRYESQEVNFWIVETTSFSVFSIILVVLFFYVGYKNRVYWILYIVDD